MTSTLTSKGGFWDGHEHDILMFSDASNHPIVQDNDLASKEANMIKM